jgi:glycosyltransferase involved in cell wall biosynthesis
VHIFEVDGNASVINKENDTFRYIAEEYRLNCINEVSPDILINSSIIDSMLDNTVMSLDEERNYINICMFYDAIPLIYPDQYLSDIDYRKCYYDKINLFYRSDLLLAISDQSKDEAITFFDIDPTKIHSISSACDGRFSRTNYSLDNANDFYSSFNIKKRYLLYVGASDPRKNIYGLLYAYSLLENSIKNSHQLIIAGDIPEFHIVDFLKKANELPINTDDLIIINRPSDEELIMLYNLSELFVFPSFHEGFGLTVLEAMSCGCPVIASNIPSMSNLLKNDNLLFNPAKPDDIADKIQFLLKNKTDLLKAKEHCFERSKAYSWENVTKLTISFLNNL